MTSPTYMAVAAAIAALAALLLSMTPYVIVARRLALAALWSSLAVVPIAVVLELGELGALSGPIVGTLASKHMGSYAGVVLPCAFIASLALGRAKAARRR